MEYIIYEAFQVFKEEGIKYGSLGIAPLAGLDEKSDNLVERLLCFVYNHLNQCYGFKDLYRAKKNYSPNARPEGLLLSVRLWVNIAYNIDDYICKRLHAKRKTDGILAGYIQKRRFYYSLLLHSPQLTQEKLKSIACPVLILAGTKDLIKKEHIRWINRQIPRCQTVFIKGAVHLDFYRKMEWYYPFIRRFLKCQCVL